MQPDRWSEPRDGRRNGGLFGARRQAIAGVFDIAPVDHFT